MSKHVVACDHRSAVGQRAGREDMVLAVGLSYLGALWLELLHQWGGVVVPTHLPLFLETVQTGSLALPVVALVVAVAARLEEPVRVTVTAATAALAVAAASPGEPLIPGDRLRSAGAAAGLAAEVLIALAALLPLAGVLALAVRPPGHPRVERSARRGAGPVLTPSHRRRTAAVGLAVGSIVTAGAGQFLVVAPAHATATATAGGVCVDAARTITYDVAAMSLDLPLNGWGDHIPDGMVYALSNGDASPNAAALKEKPGKATPLVLRAAVGDCIVVTFTNEIAGKRVGMHVDGVAKDVKTSDGAHVGSNPDTTVASGGSTTYTWYAEREGQFPINDYGSGTDFKLANPSQDTTSHGLYGGLVVLPRGFSWHDPKTGDDLLAGPDHHGIGAPVFADARGPGRADDFRDYGQVFMDEPEGVCGPGSGCPPPTFPSTGLPDSTFGFNYRTEPLRNRLRAVLDHQKGEKVTLPNGTVILPGDHFCDGYTTDQSESDNVVRLKHDEGSASCLGEESHLQSWVFGDQGKMTEPVDETDVLDLGGATGGSFALSLKDSTLLGPLTADGSAVDTSKPRFTGEVTKTADLAWNASASDVQQALLNLNVLPMADLVTGDIAVTGGDGVFTISFSQHFAGRDIQLTVDGAKLDGTTKDVVASDTATGATKGHINVLSDALVPDAYRGDPVHMRLIHAGVKETHPFHQHTNRWRQEPKDPNSTRLDVQSIGPGQTFDLNYEGGAGEAIASDGTSGPKSMQDWVAEGNAAMAAKAVNSASNGDQIFHCHLYPHFAQGFWAALRVLDRQRPSDPTAWPANTPRTYADGTPIEPLQVLPDYDIQGTTPAGATVGLTPMPDAAHPGYPLFVKGEYLQRAYRAPGAVVADRFDAPIPGTTVSWRRPGDTVRNVDSPATTDFERSNMVKGPDGKAIPGAFFINPCPEGAKTREYHPTAIDAKIVYNKAGWHDPNGKLYVEAPPGTQGDPSSSIDVADGIRRNINAGKVQPEPYNMRSRLGECVNMRTTNATNLDNNPGVPIDVHDGQLGANGPTGGNAFHPPTLMSELSTHVHLVRFDELATDGTSVGWNYVQAPMVGQTYNYRWFVDVALRTVYFHDHQNPNTHQQHGLWAAMNVEPGGSQWTDSKTGAPVVPAYCNGLGLPTPNATTMMAGESKPACYGVGSVADVKVPDPSKASGYSASFREFTVNYSDFVPLLDAAGNPINPPGHPDEFAADQGGMAINYRNEPFPIRNNSSKTGPQREPANIFSSVVHGDPSTPIFRAYQGDPVIFRFMGGAHEEGHNFTLAGHRWLHEPDDPNSNLYDSQFVMISEFFNMEVSGTQQVKRGTPSQAIKKARAQGSVDYGETLLLPGGAGAPGDYLYGSQPMNDLWMGMWGIFRVPAKRVPDLQPLPTNAAPPTAGKGEEWPALKPGGKLNVSPPDSKNPCPVGAPQKAYNVSLVKQDILYNKYGDHDPSGVAYVLDSNLDSAGKPVAGKNLKPLFIRGNEGDCLNITLTNRLPVGGIPVHPGDPLNPVEKLGTAGTSSVTNLVNGVPQTVDPTWPAGARGSLHPAGLVRYFVTGSDGSVVGYNYDSTVKPGGAITYKYYVDTRGIGIANLSDYGNLRGTRHHGAWGGLVVEPKGAAYLEPKDLTTPVKSGEQAVIKYPDSTGVSRYYREFVTDLQDGLNLFDVNDKQVPDAVKPDAPGGAIDPEDQGEKGLNYRSEPFRHRLDAGVDIADVFSSGNGIGDPATPVFRAHANDPVMVRILNSQDLPRVHTFGIFGHSWKYEQNDPNTNVVNGQGGLNTSRAFNAGICAGSNTPLTWTSDAPVCPANGMTGDYLYNDRNFFHMLSGGMWGLIRVEAPGQPGLAPLPK